MMAAYFKELLVYQLWSELYDVEWQFCEIEDRWQRIIPLRDRVTLYYVLENRQVTDTYLTNRGDPKRRRAMRTGGQGVLRGCAVHLVGW